MMGLGTFFWNCSCTNCRSWNACWPASASALLSYVEVGDLVELVVALEEPVLELDQLMPELAELRARTLHHHRVERVVWSGMCRIWQAGCTAQQHQRRGTGRQVLLPHHDRDSLHEWPDARDFGLDPTTIPLETR
jgi:hypothetical protein